MPSTRVPSYRLHRASGQAVVTLNGKDHYLGKHDTRESRAEYDATIAEWLAGGRKEDSVGTTIATLVGQYLKRSEGHFRKHGTQTNSVCIVRMLGKSLADRHGREPADSFGPRRLVALREQWIDRGLARTTINGYVRKVVEMFRWGSRRS